MIDTIFITAVATFFGVIAAIWRWHDGRDKGTRWANSSIIGTGIVCAAGAFSYWNSTGGWIYQSDVFWSVVPASLMVAYIIRKGFDGWEKWTYMLTTRALPFGVFGVAHMVYFQTTSALLFAISGLIVATVYVEGSRYSAAYKEKTGSEWMPFGFTSQMWGEISHGFFVSGLVLV